MASQAPLGTGPLWNTPGVSLPGPFRSLVRELRKNGVTGSRAYAVAWSQARRWAATSKNADTRARWGRVVAQLEAARAKARATPNKTSHGPGADLLALAQEVTMPNPCPTCGVDGAALALAVPPQFTKKTPPTGKPAAANSSVQVPKGQEAAFKALVERIVKRPGMTREKAEKAAAAILRNRKAPGGAPAAKAS